MLELLRFKNASTKPICLPIDMIRSPISANALAAVLYISAHNDSELCDIEKIKQRFEWDDEIMLDVVEELKILGYVNLDEMSSEVSDLILELCWESCRYC